MNKNDRIELKITDMAVTGEGIGKVDGLTFFVKNAVIGDQVRAVVTKMKKGYGFAKLLEILEPSPYRVKPVCELAERCGGCQLMQLSYEKQLEFKENLVAGNLERIGGIALTRTKSGSSSICTALANEEEGEKNGAKFYPIIGMQDRSNLDGGKCNAPIHFRNKMQFPVGWDNQGHVVTGFYAGRTHYIVSSNHCPVSPSVDERILEEIRNFIERNRISTYNEETGKGLVRHVLIRNGFHTGQIMVCLVINGHSLDDEMPLGSVSSLNDRFVETLTKLDLGDGGCCGEAYWNIESICLNVNTENTNVILGSEVICLYGKSYIEDMICAGTYDTPDKISEINDEKAVKMNIGKTFSIKSLKNLTFRISPLSFFQTNPKQTEGLYARALEFAGLTGNETVWDLYCGTGSISLFLAQKAKMVYGVEIIPEAIADAKQNALRNGIENTEFICGKSEEVFVEAYSGRRNGASMISEGQEKVAESSGKSKTFADSYFEFPDVVVLDPPRKGCDEALLASIKTVGPEKIVYVSCDSATLARDLKILANDEVSPGIVLADTFCTKAKYKVEKVQPVDMFPHTTHVECVCLLSKAK